MSIDFKTETLSCEGMKDLRDKFDRLNKVAPDYCFSAIQLAGTKFRKEVISLTFTKVKEHKGNLRGGYVRKAQQVGMGNNREYWCDISGGNKKGRHYHLIENGHNRIEQHIRLNGHYCHITPGFTPGIHTMKDTTQSWASGNKLVPYCEKAINKAVKQGLM